MAEHTDTIREALRECVGDGDGADETILAAHDRAVKAEALREAVYAAVMSDPLDYPFTGLGEMVGWLRARADEMEKDA